MIDRRARLAPLFLVLLLIPSPGAGSQAAEPPAIAPRGAEPVSWLDELDELRQRFEREMERMRTEFQREIERLNSADSTQELRRARARIEELERENAELRRAVRELRGGASGAIEVTPGAGGADRPRGMLGVGLAAPEPELAQGFGVTPERSVRITSVQPESPAAGMGLRAGDLITGFDGREGGLEAFMEHMSGKRAGDEVVLTYARRQEGGEILRITGRTELMAWREPAAGETPVSPPQPRAPPSPPPPAPPPAGAISLGLSVEESEAGDGVFVTEVVPEGNAAAAKLAMGDRVVRYGEREIRSIDDLRAALQRARDGNEVALRFVRGDALWESRIRLSSRPGGAALLHGPERVGGREPPPAEKEPGFLGIAPEERDGGLVVAEVVPGSPAAAMGVLVGDRILAVNDARVRTLDDLRSALSGLSAGDAVRLAVRRDGERLVLEGKLAPRSTSGAPAPAPGAAPGAPPGSSPGSSSGPSTGPSPTPRSAGAPGAAAAPREPGETIALGAGAAPATAPKGRAGATAPASARREAPRGVLGVSVVEKDGGVFVEELPAPSAAAAAGVRVGDRIRRLEGNAVTGLDELTSMLSRSRAGERIALSIERGGRTVELRVTLFAPPGESAPPAGTGSPAPAGAPKPPAPPAKSTPPSAAPSSDEPESAAAGAPPRLGVDVEERADGLWVVAVDAGAPADAAGLRAGDRVLSLGGVPVTDIESMRRAIGALRPGGSATVTVWRDGREERIEVSPEPR